ncbi:MAG: hypothetical protein RMJ44_05590 [Cytophagales bacterium]|nr:hypothetical protein [Bernardetiaceae bacterium]MDW8210540.1 hypothetical protein [Cytophagales bacterium]
MKPHFYKKLYKHIGVLLYAIAKADGKIHDKEVKAIQQIVVEDLAPLEDSVDEFGTDAAFFAEFEFEILRDREISPQKALEKFLAFAKEQDKNLTPQLRQLIIKCVEKVAISYRGTNKAEAQMIEVLKKHLLPVEKN